ncbi:MAG: HAMP domain-containing histidine kinase [Campylobacteraceae bacterium]|nr:HAMP domain-containing histidine kinase [Campylobacteraceae bacterium]
MKNLSIKIKLILIFVFIKIIPLLLISYLAYKGVKQIDKYIKNSTDYLFMQSENIINQTAKLSINDSIKHLDKKSQHSLERLSYQIANDVAQFLYQRDEDLLFLSNMNINQKLLDNFYKSKNRNIILHDEYIYDDNTHEWILKNPNNERKIPKSRNILKENKKEFSFTDPAELVKKSIPLYKEITYFNVKGKELYKVSSLDKTLKDISKKTNTYVKAENYFNEIENLKQGEIYVSNVIGKYVGSKVIGNYDKIKTAKSNLKFEPENSAYAGKENPVGKKFEGIIRFVTPVFKNKKKVGFVSLALDHQHIMQFTDTINPTGKNLVQDIINAGTGNYAFMWDNKGRNISHIRDYFILGYDKNSGKRAMPWISEDLASKYKASGLEINEFLNKYQSFDNQSLDKKPNLEQVIKDGNLGLDCRYLNFAPQCHGWMEVTKNGGFGSFIIYWSNVWKLTTAATIPYYTGQYANSKRGFGFVTIGANVDEFHAAANETKKSVTNILNKQKENMKEVVIENGFEIHKFILMLINELSIVTIIMVVIVVLIALWLSSYISKKIEKLLIGTNKFAKNELDYRIDVTSNDEIGKLEKSFNNMASKIQEQIQKEKSLIESLEKKVINEVTKQRKQEQLLVQQSKNAAMGEMISNIAHQWRQPLNALALVIQNIKFSFYTGDLNKENMEKSVTKATMLTNNMSKTIDDFRDFFKPNKVKLEFSLEKSIQKVITLVEASFSSSDINIIKDFPDYRINIFGYENELSQALLNIINNARDELIENKIKDSFIEVKLFKDKSLIVIEITDNANGIKKENVDKIFDPYFTTKEEGKGTGIGLYMTKTIIEQNMGGRLYLKASSKEGSTFRIEFKNT